MKQSDHRRKGLRRGQLALRWLAILALTGLFSIFVTPLGASAADTYSITLTPAVQTIAVGQSATVVATVTDETTSSPAVGVSVEFAVSGPGNFASGNQTTDDQGKATLTYSATSWGTDNIVASYSTATSAAATVFWTELDLSPISQTAPIGSTANITATLYRQGGDITNIPVHYTVGPYNNLVWTKYTDSSGHVTIDINGSTAGTDTVTAWADVDKNDVQGSGDPSATAHVIWINSSINITSSISPINVGGQERVVATVTDQNDDPVEGANVRFEVNSGVNNPADGDLFTNSSGNATYTYTGTNVGTDTVTAYIDLNGNNTRDSGEPFDTVNITWLNVDFNVTPSTQNAGVGSNVSVTGTVTDQFGDGVSNVLVRYSVSGANSASASRYTNSDGVTSFTYNASHAGTDTVTAWLDLNRNGTRDSGEPSDTATVYVSAGSISLAPSSQTVTVNTPASLTASLNNPSVSVSGVVIRYSVSGANSTSGTSTTNSSGNASISYTGTHAGTDTVTAYADYNNNGSKDSGEPSTSATVTWTLTATLTLSPTTTTPGVGTTSYSAVSLTTANGGVPGVPIRYTVTGANPTSGSMTTDGNGNTVIAYTGNTAGQDTLSAYADMNNNGVKDTGEPTASVTINWGGSGTTPPPPPSVFQPAQPAAAKAGCTYFAATQHNLCAGFQAYWNQFGGLNIFGMPVTEEFQENGVTVQYFERARFEWHPGAWPSHFDVLLGLLGNEVTQGRGDETPFQSTAADSTSGCTYFAVTSHNLCGKFNKYWNEFGGLAVYGYPISEAFKEKNPDTGKVYVVQYFERARFELQPGAWPEHLNVLLGRLGVQVLAMKYGAELH